MGKYVELDVYADILCPWSYIGKRRLEAALEDLPGRDRLRFRWRSYELAPDAERTPALSAAASMAQWWGDAGAARVDLIHSLGRAEGLDIDLHKAHPVNTFDAHRLTHLGAEQGRADAVVERLLHGYLCEGLNVSDPQVLTRLGTEAGLPVADVRSLLSGDAYADRVRADERSARDRGVSGVPTLVLDGGSPTDAIQTPADLRRLIEEGLRVATAHR
ncbi:DsbA family oxidoreductase [Micromonospora endophytica]|uniref:Disulfide bond formation protein DsbA n=1 Tax=Micromonospora endophytica TaxID=515350 RepID=A0A2W2D6V5_9ACTN|nr:DsbA family oxidoreductase [Micromonospora endophytica]PZG01205.1 disulfide bond formation protein DsbA [Micromonospora endophytica]RIW45854.1 DsbA family oxidoreductase [Micromonospora endophytica]BCJ61876.1 DSBA oxidoreductase [Micromonospora endophytica]